jgi:hypothetical protein
MAGSNMTPVQLSDNVVRDEHVDLLKEAVGTALDVPRQPQ